MILEDAKERGAEGMLEANHSLRLRMREVGFVLFVLGNSIERKFSGTNPG